MSNKTALGVVFFLLLALSGFGQDPAQKDAEDAAKARRSKLIDLVVRDGAELRLPENRAFISAKLGALVAKNDTERASTLFKNAVTDLIAAQGQAEANKNPNQQNYDLLMSQSLRPSVLTMIASVDAEYALASLYRTRPTAIQKALAQGVSNPKINGSSGNYQQLAQQEINLEQRLVRSLAEQKPERSVALLKESIKKNLSNETLAMLKKVWSKDPAAGNELANDVVDRLISKPFFGTSNQVNYELLSLSNSLLYEYVRDRAPEDKPIAFAESGMRSLAGKVITLYIERGSSIGYFPLRELEPIVKRFAPSSSELLKKAAATSMRGFGVHGLQNDEAISKLMSTNPTADTLIAEAKKFPVESRRSLYTNAANRLSDSGQYERALALLNENFEDADLENAISSLNWYQAHHLIQRGEYDAAEAMIMDFNESNRISALTSLATTIYNKDREANRTRANAILQRARSCLPAKPETSTEFSQLFQLINAMAGIEPSEAFRNFEPTIDQINELTEAWAIVNAFQGGNVRQGEYLLTNGLNFGVYLDPTIIRTLAQKDFDRTVDLVDNLQRREVRILLFAALLESGIQADFR